MRQRQHRTRVLLLLLVAFIAGIQLLHVTDISSATTSRAGGGKIKFLQRRRSENDTSRATLASVSPLWVDAERVEIVTEEPEPTIDPELERRALQRVKEKVDNDSDASDGKVPVAHGDGDDAAAAHTDGPKVSCGREGMRVLSAPNNNVWFKHNPAEQPRFFDYALNRQVFVFEVCVHSEPDVTSAHFMAHGATKRCDPVVDTLLSLHSNRSVTFVDVGAGIGICAIMVASLGYKVVAFEPESVSADLLARSAQLNDVTSLLEVKRLVAWDNSTSSASKRIFVPEGNFDSAVVPSDASGASLRSVDEWSNSTFAVDATDTRMIDDVIDHAMPTAAVLMNVDANGAELRALRGARIFIREHVTLGKSLAIRVSFNVDLLAVVGDSPLELLIELHNLGLLLYASERSARGHQTIWLQPSLYRTFVDHLERHDRSRIWLSCAPNPDWRVQQQLNISSFATAAPADGDGSSLIDSFLKSFQALFSRRSSGAEGDEDD